MKDINIQNSIKLSNIQIGYSIVLLLSVSAFFLLTACNNNEENARILLQNAEKYNEANEFGMARSQIDSIKILYPKELQVLKEGNLLMWKIELNEQTRSLVYLDSLLIIYKEQAELFKKNLTFEKDKEYQKYGIYIDKNQSVERMIGQSYLKFSVNEIGEMSVGATVYGKGKGKYNAIKAETANGEYIEPPIIPANDGNNYVFEDGGVTTQVLNFIRGKDNGFSDFLYTYKDVPLKIIYIGGNSPFSYSLSRTEKEAMIKVYDLSSALLNINDISGKINAAKAKIEFCKQTIAKQTSN